MKKFLLIVFSFYFISSSSGQSPDNLPHKLGIGFSVGSSIGSGFSFRYNVSEKVGVQSTAIFPIYNYTIRSIPYELLMYIIGGSMYYNFVTTSSLRFFSYLGAKYRRTVTWDENLCIGCEINLRYKNINKYVGGLGVGLEFYIKPNMGFSVMGGYGAFDNDGEFKTGISGESSILFYFK